jgi:hypothetical protein
MRIQVGIQVRHLMLGNKKYCICIQVRSVIRKGNYGYKIFQFFLE